MYWTLGIGALAAMWLAAWLLRLAARTALGLATG
jgi:hypothetical protein